MSGYISLVLVIDFSAAEEKEVFISHTDDYSPKIEKSLPIIKFHFYVLKTSAIIKTAMKENNLWKYDNK